MSDTFCNSGGKRDETIVSYVYGEMEAEDRAAFDRHLAACAPCRAELSDLHDVRQELSRWAPPEPSSYLPLSLPLDRAAASAAPVRARAVPVWAQAIAATVLIGASLGIANFDVSYSAAHGLSVRTGWRHETAAINPQPAAAVAPVAATSGAPAPWSSDLAALAAELRSAIDARPVTATPVAAGSDDAVMRRVRQMLQDSERRQQSELALRMAEAVRELQQQRQADLVKIDRTLGLMQSRTGFEVMRTQRQMNSLAQQVSQRP